MLPSPRAILARISAIFFTLFPSSRETRDVKGGMDSRIQEEEGSEEEEVKDQGGALILAGLKGERRGRCFFETGY